MSVRVTRDGDSGREPIGVIGAGWVGLVTAACFAELGHERLLPRHRAPRRSRPSRAARCRSTSPGSPSCSARNAERLHFTTEHGRGARAAPACCSAASTPRPPTPGDADLSRVERVIEELGDSADHALVMKSTVPGRHRARDRAAGAHGELGYVSNPEFLKEGTAVEDFMQPDRVVVGRTSARAAFADARGRALRAARRADRAHRRRQRGDDQARLERLPGHEDLLHQRDRQRLRGAGRRRGRGRPREWASTRASARSSCSAGIGYGGSCFPKDVSALKQLAGNSGYHFQLLTAVIEVNELQKRRTIGKLQKHLGSLVGKEIALLGRRLQAEHGRRARGHQPRAGRAAAGRGRARARLRPGRRGERAARCSRAPRSCESALEALEGADGAVLVTEWPEFADLDWAEVQGQHGRPLVVDGRNFLDARGAAPRRLRVRGRRPTAVSGRPRSPPSAPTRACRRSSWPAARVRACGRSPSRSPKPVMPLAGRPFLSFMLDWLAGHGVDEAVLSCGFLAQGVRRRARPRARGHAAALRHRGRAPRHRRTGAPGRRRGRARRARARPQRRRADRLRPRRAGRAPRGARRARHARARAVADTSSYGRRAHGGRRRGRGLPREAARDPAAHATGSTPAPTCWSAGSWTDPGRAAGLLRAGGLPRAGRRGALRLSRPTATGSTSGRPERYLEATRDLLDRTHRRARCRRATADRSLVRRARGSPRAREVGPLTVVGARRGGRGRSAGARAPCSSTACARWARTAASARRCSAPTSCWRTGRARRPGRWQRRTAAEGASGGARRARGAGGARARVSRRGRSRRRSRLGAPRRGTPCAGRSASVSGGERLARAPRRSPPGPGRDG